MSHLKVSEMVPEVYVSESRDFQTFTSILSIVQNSILNNMDSLTSTLDTSTCVESVLELLAAKLGFFYDQSNSYTPYELRLVLSAFPHIVKYKGSIEGINRCVAVFNRSQNLRGVAPPQFPSNLDSEIHFTYTQRVNENLLRDLLSYVLPTGYVVKVFYDY